MLTHFKRKMGEKLSENEVNNTDIYRNLLNYRGIIEKNWLEMLLSWYLLPRVR